MNQNELTHYGVLGMKWGVRKNAKKLADSFYTDSGYNGPKSKEIYKEYRKIEKKRNRGKSYKRAAKIAAFELGYTALTGDLSVILGQTLYTPILVAKSAYKALENSNVDREVNRILDEYTRQFGEQAKIEDIMNTVKTNQELSHYGILGMKWGVRRYQNPDGTLTDAGRKRYSGDSDYIFEAGTKFNSTVAENTYSSNKDKASIFVYESGNEHDSEVYRGSFAMYKMLNGEGKVGSISMSAAERLISPGDKKRVDIFIESYRNDPATFSQALNSIKPKIPNRGRDNKGARDYEFIKSANKVRRYSDQTSTKDLRNSGYNAFMLGSSLYSDPKVKAAYDSFYENIKNKGYNALIDDNNREVYNGANKPLIVFDKEKSLSKASDIEWLEPLEIYKNIGSLKMKNMKAGYDYNVSY